MVFIGNFLSVDQENYPCSFGMHSQSNYDGLVVAKLGADGSTFTTEIDAMITSSFTHFDLPNQMQGNETNYWLKFSSTDIYLADNISWAFIEDSEFSEVLTGPVQSFQTIPEKDWNGIPMTSLFIE